MSGSRLPDISGSTRRAILQVTLQPFAEASRQRIVLTVTVGQQRPVRTANGLFHQCLDCAERLSGTFASGASLRQTTGFSA
jgi:hypothetical protein